MRNVWIITISLLCISLCACGQSKKEVGEQGDSTAVATQCDSVVGAAVDDSIASTGQDEDSLAKDSFKGYDTYDIVSEPYDSIRLVVKKLGLDVSVQKHMNMSDDGILRMKIYDRVGKLLHHFKLENANECAMELFRGEKPEYVYLYSVSGNASFGNILMIDIKRGCELKEIFETRIGVVDVKRFRRGFIVKQYINGRWVDKNYDEHHTITIDFTGNILSDKKEITEMEIPYVIDQ